MKTKKQWLEELPEGYRELALSNFDFRFNSIPKKNMVDALSVSFAWNETKQGHDFWEKVCNHYEIGTPLPPLPSN